MKVYVRTKDGYIGEIVEVGKYTLTMSINGVIRYVDIDNVKNTSPLILELVEIEDLLKIEYFSPRYVDRVTRLFEVDYKNEEYMNINNAHCEFTLRFNEFNEEDKKLKPIIKSIVTREQFAKGESIL